jgi:hypothetical protein
MWTHRGELWYIKIYDKFCRLIDDNGVKTIAVEYDNVEIYMIV